MPRSKTQAPHIERAALNHEVIAADAIAMDADAPRRMEIIEHFGDGQPFEETRVINEARFYANQTAQGMFEFAKRLVLLKEFLPHGQFVEAIDALGISPRTAQNMMSAAVKLVALKPTERDQLLALGATKIYDLALLEDGDLAELAKGKTVAGITLDEIDTMGSRELRAKLREAQQELDAKDRVVEQKDKKINRLLELDVKTPAWKKTFDRTLNDISAKGDALMRACADMAELARAIADMDFEGVEGRNDTLTLRAQIANRYYDLSEHLLEQSVGLFVGARSEYIEGLLTMARKKLPEDIKAKIFGDEK